MAKEEAPNSDDPPSLVAGGFIQLEHNWPCMLCRWLLALQPIPVLWARDLGFSPFFLRQFFFKKREVRAGVAAAEPERNRARSTCLHYSDPVGFLQGPRIDWRSLKEGAGGAEPVRGIR